MKDGVTGPFSISRSEQRAMTEISRKNSATVEMAVESVTNAVRKKAAGVDMTFAPGFAVAVDLWCDVEVGVLDTWEKRIVRLRYWRHCGWALLRKRCCWTFLGCAQGMCLVSSFCCRKSKDD